MKIGYALSILLGGCLLLASPAHSEIIGGVEFPDGAVSFADAVVSFNPVIVSGQPTARYLVPGDALGIPDFTGDTSCVSGCTFVSLGDGGSLVLQFTDNLLTGSGTSDLDLWVFEIGPDVEDTFVDVSTDGSTWTPVGKVFGSTSGIDLDAYGFGPDDTFAFVRLTDDPNEGANSGSTVGADIDALGAISSVGSCTISNVTPAFAWEVGQTIEIFGDGFVDGSIPSINGVDAAPYEITAAGTILATVPSVPDGFHVLAVTRPDGRRCEFSTEVLPVENSSWGALKQMHN